ILKKIKPYHKILEMDLWDDIVSRSLDPDASVSSPILPSRPWFGAYNFGMGEYNKSTPGKWYYGNSYYEKQITNINDWFIIDEYEVFQICEI
ncbi:13955_t:CDS:2, partial [Dentiscutata heterogama]